MKYEKIDYIRITDDVTGQVVERPMNEADYALFKDSDVVESPPENPKPETPDA